MGISESGRDIFLNLDTDNAFSLVEKAGESIGKVLSSSKVTGSIEIKTRYGLAGVKLRISIMPHESGNGTKVQIGGRGGDIWGAGASKGAHKLLAAIEKLS